MIILNIKLNNLPVFVFADRFKSPADLIFEPLCTRSAQIQASLLTGSQGVTALVR